MQPLELLPFRAALDPELGCVSVTLQPLMIALPFQVTASLSDPRLGQLVRASARPCLVLDLSADELASEALQWIAAAWTPLLYQVGIQRLAIVARNPAHLAPYAGSRGPVSIVAFAAGDAAGLRAFAGVSPAAVAAYPALAAPPGAVPRGRSMSLALPPRAWGFAAGVGGLVGALLGAGIAKLCFALGAEAEMAEQLYYGAGAIVGFGLAVAGVLAVHFARGVPGARIEWDETGITEYVGDRPATAIAWADARVALLRGTLVYKSHGAVTGRSEGRTAQIQDRSGKTITICDGHQQPDWLRNRPAWVESIPGEVLARGQAIPIVPDKLGLGRAALVLFGVVALLSYAALSVGSLKPTWAGRDDAMVLGVGVVLFGLRMLWPATKLGSRGTVGALVELGLRSIVLLVYVGLALACWAHDQSP